MVLIILFLLVTVFFNPFHKVLPPQASYNDKFEMIKLIEQSKYGLGSVVFAIRDINTSFEEIMFFTDRYAYESTNAYWGKNNNDIFVFSHDVGVEVYISKGGTWEPG